MSPLAAAARASLSAASMPSPEEEAHERAAACEAAGLEVAVRAWWRGAPGRGGLGTPGRGRQKAEDAWLRAGAAACASVGMERGSVAAAALAAAERLRSCCVPSCVVESGVQLGIWMDQDVEVRALWPECKKRLSDFMPRAVGHVFERFHISVAPSGLHLAPKPRVLAPTKPIVASSIPLASAGQASCGVSATAGRRPSIKPALPVLFRQSSENHISEMSVVEADVAKAPLPRMASNATSMALEGSVPAAPPPPHGSRGCSSKRVQVLDLPPNSQQSPLSLRHRRALRASAFDKWEGAHMPRHGQPSHKEVVLEEGEKNVERPISVPLLRTYYVSSTKQFMDKIVTNLYRVQEIFETFDKDQSGFIEPTEFIPMLSEVLRISAWELDPDNVWHHWDVMDVRGSGKVYFPEFQKWYTETFNLHVPDFTSSFEPLDGEQLWIREVVVSTGVDAIVVDKLWKKFQSLDEDQSGHLEFQEFLPLVQNLMREETKISDNMSEKLVRIMWIQVDSDGSGTVTFEEFVAWYSRFFLSGISPMEEYYKQIGSGFRQLAASHAPDPRSQGSIRERRKARAHALFGM